MTIETPVSPFGTPSTRVSSTRDSSASRGLAARRSAPRTDPIRTGPVTTPVTRAAGTAPLTRRAAREAESVAGRATQRAAAKKGLVTRKGLVTGVVMTLTAGLIGTMALPAFALTPNSSGPQVTASGLTSGQTVSVAAGTADSNVSRDGYTTTVPVVQKAVIASTVSTALASTSTASSTAAAEAKRASLAASYAAYTGPTASDYLANPAHPAFSLAAVYQTALKYQGTPYVFGGATPAGFDCSGFVMFVYAQYGISLTHSVPVQLTEGTIISPADAEPGDVIVLDNGTHDGFYAGNGMILDAPKPGGVVSVRPLWTTAVHYVRFGIK